MSTDEPAYTLRQLRGAFYAGQKRGEEARAMALADTEPSVMPQAMLRLFGAVIVNNLAFHWLREVWPTHPPAAQVLTETIEGMISRACEVDAITLAEELMRQGKYESAGGDRTIAAIANGWGSHEPISPGALGDLIIPAMAEVLALQCRETGDTSLMLASRRLVSHLAPWGAGL